MASMSLEQTSLANSIDASANREKLDVAAKNVIKNKAILANILKECAEEFRGYDAAYIGRECLAGDVKVSEVAVDQDMLDSDSSVAGSDTEDSSDKEGLVR